MQLLVSVANAEEADAALIGGAIIIDAKDPTAGALAPVAIDVFRTIQTVVGGIRPVSAALGDAADEATIEAAARQFADASAAFVKLGCAGVESRARVRSLNAAAVRGTSGYASGLFGSVGVVAVAYADRAAITPLDIIAAASSAGATGVLIDTADKDGPGLRALMTTSALTSWVRHAHEAGLTAAVAGRLSVDDLKWARDSGADIVGVRGAACETGRTSRVVAEKVRLLRAAATLTLV
jgi:uncharacterized protein (UPF0264 family)